MMSKSIYIFSYPYRKRLPYCSHGNDKFTGRHRCLMTRTTNEKERWTMNWLVILNAFIFLREVKSLKSEILKKANFNLAFSGVNFYRIWRLKDLNI